MAAGGYVAVYHVKKGSDKRLKVQNVDEPSCIFFEVLSLSPKKIEIVLVANSVVSFPLARDAATCSDLVRDAAFLVLHQGLELHPRKIEYSEVIKQDVFRHVDTSEHHHLFFLVPWVVRLKVTGRVLVTSDWLIDPDFFPAVLGISHVQHIKISQASALFTLSSIHKVKGL